MGKESGNVGNSPKAKFRSVRLERFRKSFEKLPKHIQGLANRKYERFMKNPNDPTLQMEPISSRPGHYEIHITRDYRATCWKERDKKGSLVYVWYWAGTHNEFDKKS